jgi:Glycosyltransferase family 87
MHDGGTDAERRARPTRQPAGWYAAWVVAMAFAFFGVWHALEVGLGYDSHAYWAAVQHMDRLYDAPALSRDAYLYSPLFAQLVWPLGRLPWPTFYVLWTAVMAAVFVWLLRPLGRRWFLPAFIATIPEILTGNVYALMAAALVLGASSGPPWVLLGLTKVTGGGVGLTWLTLTRQWRAVLVGLLTAAGAVGLSYAVGPDQWGAWIEFLMHGSTPTTNSISSPVLTLVLLGGGVAAVVVGALTRRAWLLAVAAVLVSPTIGLNTLTLLAAVPRLARWPWDSGAETPLPSAAQQASSGTPPA